MSISILRGNWLVYGKLVAVIRDPAPWPAIIIMDEDDDLPCLRLRVCKLSFLREIGLGWLWIFW